MQPNKNRIILFVVIMTSLTQAPLVLYTPAFLQIAQFFHIRDSLVKTTLTAYLFGFGVSQLLYGPISDRIGRKKPLLAGLLLLLLGCFWSIFAMNYKGFLFSRIVQGIGAGSCMALPRSILRDCFEGKEYIRVASYLSSGFAIGLGVTPLIGGYLISYFPWQSEFIFLIVCTAMALLLFFLFLPETYPITEKTASIIPAKKTFILNSAKLFCKVIVNRNFIGYLLGGVMSYSVLIAYNTMAPFLFQRTIGKSGMFYGCLTFFVSVIYYAGTAFNRRFLTYYSVNFMFKVGLSLIVLSGVLMLFCNAILNGLNVYSIFIPILTATFGQALIWSNCIAAALEDFSTFSGTASAFFSSFQMLISALVSAMIATLPESSQITLPLVIIVLGGISWSALYFCAFRKESVVYL